MVQRRRRGGRFRRVNPAASLKRRPVGVVRRRLVVFPPGKSGGLIEAVTYGRCVASWTSWGFRRVNPAASLKPHGPIAGSAYYQSGFRRVNPAASLKQAAVRLGGQADAGGFRRVNPAASLKHGDPDGCLVLGVLVSAG